MLQHRGLLRCLLAGTLALAGALVITRLPIAVATPPQYQAVTAGRLALTVTSPITLALSSGAFIEVQQTNLPGVRYGSADWGDCNNDGAADILLTGQVSSTLKIARVYQRKIDGSFELAATFDGVMQGAAAWGDFDNDGWLDIALTGENDTGPISQLHHNERGSSACAFSAVATSFGGVSQSAVAWSDYNADGQLDLLISGNDGSQPVTRLYRNEQGTFIDSGLNLPGIQNGAAVWGDYNNDARPDLLLTGLTLGSAPLTKIFRNDGSGALTEIVSGLPALSESAAAWGDYDNDGDLDVLLEGTPNLSEYIAEVYRNDQGTFTKLDAGNLIGSLTWSGAGWGDFDTDGYLDVLISSESFARAFRYAPISDSFESGIQVGPSLLDGTAAWGNYDNDGNLDVLVTGRSTQGWITKIYRYSAFVLSTPPDPPTDLTAVLDGTRVTLQWSPSPTDDYTLLEGLSYNLRIGTQPGGIDVIAPMALTGTGTRLLPAAGNVYQARSVTLHNLVVGQSYYWSVQAIDTSFLGSYFAAEGTFLVPHRVFLPALLKDVVDYYTGEGENEPNNTSLQANGALVSGQLYRGAHNDERDYFSLYLRDTGTLTVAMDSPNGGTQIQLFYQVADVAHRVGFDPTAPYHIEHTGAPGWYYILVYTNPDYAGTEPYTLTATYP
jgi:hypothetical protein